MEGRPAAGVELFPGRVELVDRAGQPLGAAPRKRPTEVLMLTRTAVSCALFSVKSLATAESSASSSEKLRKHSSKALPLLTASCSLKPFSR